MVLFSRLPVGSYFQCTFDPPNVPGVRYRKVGTASYIEIEYDGYSGEETLRKVRSNFYVIPEVSVDVRTSRI